MVDVSKIKVGDELEFCRVKVVENDGSQVPIRIEWPGGTKGDGEWFKACRFIRHIPAPRSFAPGDQVTWGGGDFIGEIKCIDGEDAWIKTDHGRCTIHVSNLRHADAPADEIVVTCVEADEFRAALKARPITINSDTESSLVEAYRAALVDFLKRRKEAGR